MLVLQLLCNGLVTGCALGMIAVSFSLVYSTTRIFHVAHAGVLSLGGYVTYALMQAGLPLLPAAVLAIAIAALAGAAIQVLLYARLERQGAAHLVVLIASLGLLAMIQNAISGVFTPNTLTFAFDWGNVTQRVGGVILTRTQLLTVIVGVGVYLGLLGFVKRSPLGRRIRAVASNPFLGQITRLQPQRTYVVVMMIASGVVAIPGILLGLDLGLQPYGGITLLLTATIAMIAGGVGSITGAFVVAVAIAVLQNMFLLVIPGEWSIGVTFAVFVAFMLLRPRGLFAAA
jgi:branched-chain amino acid transport system permease protein